jgi:hypothetical protein
MPVVIQWLLATLLVMYGIGKYESKQKSSWFQTFAMLWMTVCSETLAFKIQMLGNFNLNLFNPYDNNVYRMHPSFLITRRKHTTIKRLFRNKLKFLLTAVWLIILSHDSFFIVSIKVDTANFVICLFLASLKLPVCQSNILFTQRYWASWSESPLITKEWILICCNQKRSDQ